MSIFKRRCKCILCSRYHDMDNIYYSYYGIGVCSSCLEAYRTVGDRSFEAKAPVDYVLAPFYYDDKIKRAVKRFKFTEQRAYGIIFGELIATELKEYSNIFREFDCIIPIPLHWTRLEDRGYNQAEVIAETLAKKFDLPCILDGVFRIKETKQQSRLRARERIENVRSAFCAAESIIKDRKIILVDDIFTMGETMSACATALKDAGAGSIIGISLCKPMLIERPLITDKN